MHPTSTSQRLSRSTLDPSYIYAFTGKTDGAMLEHVRNARRHIRLAICSLARKVLPAETPSKRGIELRRTVFEFGGNQRVLLFAATPGLLQAVVRRYA